MKQQPLFSAFLAILLWATLASLGVFTQRLPPFLVTAIALGIGSLLSIRHYRQWRVPFKVLATGVVGIFGYHALIFTAFRTAPPLEANLLNYLWPLLLVLLSPLFRLGNLQWQHLVASIAGFCGAVLIVTQGKLQVPATLPSGYLFAIAAALTWSCYSLLLRKLPSFPNSVVGFFCLLSAILAGICHCLFEPSVTPNTSEWLALLIIGIGPLGMAFFLWDKAMKQADPRQVGVLAYLTPLLSTLLLALSGLGEMTSTSWLAGALILGGATIGSLKLKPRQRLTTLPTSQ
ncbi:DMT family transporter [Vogesella oryzae]|uniref:DMT family transporter n=1 Tax=Vogesella oryzae TaxID=1735285 RepID=UPI0015842CCE|nr:DMT family transporter [Vogesella oryzae]